MELVCENGEKLRVAPHARWYCNPFSYQVIGRNIKHEGLFTQRGCVTVVDAAELKNKGLLLSPTTSIFDNPALCDSMFQWDTSSELAFIMKNRVDDARLLDVGCGWGRLLEGLVRLGVCADGFDSSPRLVDAARNRLPPSVGLFVSSMSDFCAPRAYSLAFAAMNTIRYARSHWELVSHLRLISQSLVPGGRYLVHTSLLQDPRNVSSTAWEFKHKGKQYRAQWRGESIDYFHSVLYEEVTLTDLDTGAQHREIQRQLLFSLSELVQYAADAGPLELLDVSDERGRSVALNSTDLNGRYWITFGRPSP
jgi:hypothetical protein